MQLWLLAKVILVFPCRMPQCNNTRPKIRRRTGSVEGSSSEDTHYQYTELEAEESSVEAVAAATERVQVRDVQYPFGMQHQSRRVA